VTLLPARGRADKPLRQHHAAVRWIAWSAAYLDRERVHAEAEQRLATDGRALQQQVPEVQERMAPMASAKLIVRRQFRVCWERSRAADIWGAAVTYRSSIGAGLVRVVINDARSTRSVSAEPA
jgi:hypothetical protein